MPISKTFRPLCFLFFPFLLKTFSFATDQTQPPQHSAHISSLSSLWRSTPSTNIYKKPTKEEDIELFLLKPNQNSLTSSSCLEPIYKKNNPFDPREISYHPDPQYGPLSPKEIIEAAYTNTQARQELCYRLFHHILVDVQIREIKSFRLFLLESTDLSTLSPIEIYTLLKIENYKPYFPHILDHLEKKAGDQNPTYLWLLGYIKDRLNDPQKAFHYGQLAAEQGYPPAQNFLSGFYRYGIGIPQDDKKAFHYIELAAKEGYTRAQYNLGLCYEIGQGCTQDLQKAVEYYQKAADKKNAYAYNALGQLYHYGRVAQENAFSYKMWENLYEYKPKDIKKNRQEAIKYYGLAANQGSISALFHLAYMCHYEQAFSAGPQKILTYYQLIEKHEDLLPKEANFPIHFRRFLEDNRDFILPTAREGSKIAFDLLSTFL